MGQLINTLAPLNGHSAPISVGLVEPILSDGFINIYTTDPSAVLCEDIIRHSETKEWADSQVVGKYADNTDAVGRTLREQRDSQQQSYPANRFPEVHAPMLGWFARCLNSYLAMFPSANDFPAFSVYEHYQVVRYLDGQAFHAVHNDYYPYGSLNRRHLTGVAFLNDVAVGGELVFPQQDRRVKPAPGNLVIFPSGWTHAHKTLPPVGQSRYVFQVWWGFDRPDEVLPDGRISSEPPPE
jgi:predicted 2-oxoglutarate/Fe(II)-dependent dioxygenase YbiX